MAENLGGRFATMSDEERRRFALEHGGEADGPVEEIALGDPRKDHPTTKANLEDRDGEGALVDEAQHAQRVREETRRQNPLSRSE